MAHYILDARTATPHFPGIGRYVINLAQAIVPHLADNEHLTILYDLHHPLRLASNPRTTLRSLDISPFSLRQQWQISPLLKQLQATVYHSSYYLMAYWPRVPTVLTIYDMIPIHFPEHSTWRARTFFRWMTRLALRAAQYTFAISEATRQDYIEHFHVAPETMLTTPLSADPVFQPQTAETLAALREKYTLPERYVLYLGSNKPHKNLVRLVEAWAQVKQAGLPHQLVIAGAWLPQHPESRQRAQALGLDDAIHWLGRVSSADMAPLFAAAEAFVFPSLYEGFGLPPLEAMACGTPVACAATSSLPEVVGDAAVCFDPISSQAIADALKQLLSDTTLRDTLRQKGLARAAQFSWSRTAEATLACYRQIS